MSLRNDSNNGPQVWNTKLEEFYGMQKRWQQEEISTKPTYDKQCVHVLWRLKKTTNIDRSEALEREHREARGVEGSGRWWNGERIVEPEHAGGGSSKVCGIRVCGVNMVMWMRVQE